MAVFFMGPMGTGHFENLLCGHGHLSFPNRLLAGIWLADNGLPLNQRRKINADFRRISYRTAIRSRINKHGGQRARDRQRRLEERIAGFKGEIPTLRRGFHEYLDYVSIDPTLPGSPSSSNEVESFH